MHSALALSLSSPFFKPLKLSYSPNRALFLKPFHLNFTCDSRLRLRNSAPIYRFSDSSIPRPDFKLKAASVPDSKNRGHNSDLFRNAQLAAMFGLWYLLNIYFNIFNKQVLKVHPFPATVSAFQFGFGSLVATVMWALNLHPRPNLTRSQIAAIIPVAGAHAIGNILTNISLGKVAVSFTHTIKAMEPFFTVLFASIFLGEVPSLWVVTSLLPIVGGVALASFTEASFNWTGFCCAMVSNVTNQSRNVLSKKFMYSTKEALDNINLFNVITITCFILSAPAAIFLEGFKFTPSYLHSAANSGVNVRELIARALLSGICFHSYQQVSYMILEMVNPVTHAVGNCVKRVVVIVSSLIFFQSPISPLSSIGTALALAGVFLYSRVKRIKPKPKAS